MKCLSLFSGCGGLDLGFHQAGFEIVGGVDTEPLCKESHSKKFGSEFFVGTVSEFVQSGQLDRIQDEIDVVVGGPPCPAFSKSRFYRADKPRGIEDASAFDALSSFFEVVTKVSPKAFLLENVKGLLYKSHSTSFEFIEKQARDLGYKLAVASINCADYGVPQIRERCFLVGTKEAAYEFPDATHSKGGENNLLPWVNVGTAFSGIENIQKEPKDGHFAGGKHHDCLKEVPPGDNYLYFTAKRGHPDPKFEWRSRYWSFLLKLDPNLPSWTIQARRSNNMGPFHWNSRILTINEIKRIQTFPDDFELAGSIEQQWRQIGNAVPPLMAQHLADAMLRSLTANSLVIAAE